MSADAGADADIHCPVSSTEHYDRAAAGRVCVVVNGSVAARFLEDTAYLNGANLFPSAEDDDEGPEAESYGVYNACGYDHSLHEVRLWAGVVLDDVQRVIYDTAIYDGA